MNASVDYFLQFSTMMRSLGGAAEVSLRSPVLMFHGYFDESGKWRDKDTISFCGWNARAGLWEDGFSKPWVALLNEIGIDELHTAQFVALKGDYLPLRDRIKLDEVESILLRFAEVIRNTVAMGYAAAVDTRHLRSMKQTFRAKLGDPHYMAFKVMMNEVLRDMTLVQNSQMPPDIDVRTGIICDQDPGTSEHCLKWFNKFRQVDARARRHLSSICFAESLGTIPLQAADLLAYAIRMEVERRRVDSSPKSASPLYRALSSRPDESGSNHDFLRGYIMDARFLDMAEQGQYPNWFASMEIDI